MADVQLQIPVDINDEISYHEFLTILTRRLLNTEDKVSTLEDKVSTLEANYTTLEARVTALEP